MGGNIDELPGSESLDEAGTGALESGPLARREEALSVACRSEWKSGPESRAAKLRKHEPIPCGVFQGSGHRAGPDASFAGPAERLGKRPAILSPARSVPDAHAARRAALPGYHLPLSRASNFAAMA